MLCGFLWNFSTKASISFDNRIHESLSLVEIWDEWSFDVVLHLLSYNKLTISLPEPSSLRYILSILEGTTKLSSWTSPFFKSSGLSNRELASLRTSPLIMTKTDWLKQRLLTVLVISTALLPVNEVTRASFEIKSHFNQRHTVQLSIQGTCELNLYLKQLNTFIFRRVCSYESGQVQLAVWRLCKRGMENNRSLHVEYNACLLSVNIE